MDHQKSHSNYSAEDIQLYLSGQLSPAQMHAMEKAALDDPFLEEAMEGYANLDKKNWEQQWAHLHQSPISTTTAPVVSFTKQRSSTFWRAAAAILIIVSGLAISYLVSKNNTSPKDTFASRRVLPPIDTLNAATTITSVVPAPQPDSVTSTLSTADNTNIAQPTVSPRRTTTKRGGPGLPGSTEISLEQAATAGTAETASPPHTAEERDAIRSRSLAADKKEDQRLSKEQSEMRRQTTVAATTPSLFERRDSAQSTFQKSMNRFSAQVVGPDGSPLPFANISITNDQVGTYADVKGNFRLITTDSVLPIEIRSAGYITKRVTLHKDLPPGNIVLAEDHLALKGKTLVTGTSQPLAIKQRAVLVPDTVINVEPADGWGNYNTYLTNNLFLPREIKQKQIHGEVEISFEVETNGAITNLKIDRSLCPECDEATLRAIQDGPKWKVKKGAKSSGRVKVKF